MLFGAFSAAGSHAGNYECFAQANADRGFNFDFYISVEPASVGGQIVLKAGDRQRVIGTVSETGLLDRADATQRPAFDLTLGYIGAEDVSGIPASSLSLVKTIEVFKAVSADGDEALVYKLLDGNSQIGGAVMISGMGTACLPK